MGISPPILMRQAAYTSNGGKETMNKIIETGLTIKELEMFFFGEEPVPQEIMWKLEREFFNDVYGCHDSIVDAEDYFEEDIEEYRLEDLIAEEHLEEVLSWMRA